MVHVKTKHLKNLYDKKLKSLGTYKDKQAFKEHVEIAMGVAMDRIERWQPEEKKGDIVDEAVEVVSETLTGDMPDFSAPEKEDPEEGESEKDDSPEKTKKTRGGKK